MNKPSPLNILVLTSTFPRWEGDSTPPFVAQFCEQLVKAGKANIEVLAPHAYGAAAKEKLYGFRVRRFRYFLPLKYQTIAYEGGAVAKVSKHPLYLLKLTFFMTSMLFSTISLVILHRQKIINAHWIIPMGFIAVICKFLTRRKVVITVHGGDIFSLNSRLFKRIKRFTLKHADAVVTNSSATFKACQALLPNRKYQLIPMGIDIKRFSPGESSINSVSPNQPLNILFVGRLSEEKGCIYLLQALDMLKRSRYDFKAMIVGEGPLSTTLQQFTKENSLDNYVTFAGWVDSTAVVDFYRKSDVFVGPSIIAESGWQEALGLVFVESLAMGVPVITTSTGGISDVVTDNINGFLIPQKCPTAIFEKLQLMHEQPELVKRMSEAARQKVVNNFSWEQVIQRYSSEVFNHHNNTSKPQIDNKG